MSMRWAAASVLAWCVVHVGVARADKLPLPPRAIEDPSGTMARFYAALAKVHAKQPGTIVRILNYGDSFTSNDAITRRLRERLQELYGDGGQGWVPFALPSPSFRHMTAKRTHSGWKVKNVTFKRIPDKLYSIGGSAFEGSAGAQSTFFTMPKGTLGRTVSRYDVQYLVQPKSGTLELTLDGKPHAVIDTAGDAPKLGTHSFEVPDGAHTLKVRVSKGHVRVYGVVMERPGPGITYDNLGLASNSAKSLTGMNAEHLREQHEHRKADLVVIHLGGNGAVWESTSQKMFDRYQVVQSAFLKLLRGAAPKVACLVMASTDAGAVVKGTVVTRPALPGVVEAQRKAAFENGCAFWDTFTWMGGKGSIRRWRQDGFWSPGLSHPNTPGAERIALGLVDALVSGFDQHRARKGK